MCSFHLLLQLLTQFPFLSLCSQSDYRSLDSPAWSGKRLPGWGIISRYIPDSLVVTRCLLLISGLPPKMLMVTIPLYCFPFAFLCVSFLFMLLFYHICLILFLCIHFTSTHFGIYATLQDKGCHEEGGWVHGRCQLYL